MLLACPLKTDPREKIGLMQKRGRTKAKGTILI